MSLFTDADLAGMLGDSGDFGETVTVAGSDLSGVFFNGHAEALDVDGRDATLLVRSADVDGVAEGDSAVVRGASYTVGRVMPSGQGFTKLKLVAV